MLIHELTRRGNQLFRWRSFIPLILVPPALGLAYDAPARAGDAGWQALCWAVGLLGVLQDAPHLQGPVGAHAYVILLPVAAVGIVRA